MLTVVGYAKLQVVVDACSNEPRGPPITSQEHSHAFILQQALHHIPNHTTEFTTRNVAIRLGQQLAEQVCRICLGSSFLNCSSAVITYGFSIEITGLALHSTFPTS
jgi:ubiquitin carboxyl-terminal hydrolase 9/24